MPTGLARHEMGPWARAWAVAAARGRARPDTVDHSAVPGPARSLPGLAGLEPGPGRAAQMDIYSGAQLKYHRVQQFAAPFDHSYSSVR